ncbi:alpha/beta fold hydrolase [Luteimonas sp. SX5]|uniref:Alpha/beta fold hydrolase n=1 Tax=Luteimonas galliterrae TaxID=2940486 RepID=A0ABT0MM60_9GAMM|nr:alpha/beta fold hydrolase [Luteimonas galliterrae]MCL1635960.1 alpha/beta fold hydrolase [Luteimonas galliterrae]
MRTLPCCSLLVLALAACTQPATAPSPPAAASAAAPIAALAAGERRIKMSDGAEIYLKVAGKGPVCMLVHGGPGQGSLSTEKMGADKLEDFLTMVWLDQRGSGKSPDAQDYRLERVVQDFDEVRRALGADKMCLIAHSFGGILAVEYAKRYPQHVSELVLANSTLHFLGPENSRMQIAFVNRLLGRTVVAVADDANEAALAEGRERARAALMKSGKGYRFLTENTDSIRVMSEIDGGYERSRGFGNAIFEQRGAYPEYWIDYAPVSARIRSPVLVITSSKDYAVGPDEYKRFRFAHQKTVTLDGGHISYYENNAEFVAAIREFMAGRR